MKHLAAFMSIGGLLSISGCANQVAPGTVELTVSSQPPGAYITEKNSSNAGVAPVTAWYKIDTLAKDKNGCYLVSGFNARWGSGASTSSGNTLRMCPPQKEFTVVLKRNPADPGLDKDLAFANKLQRQQQEDGAAVGNALLEGIAAGATSTNNRSTGSQELRLAPTRCITKQVWGRIETECQ